MRLKAAAGLSLVVLATAALINGCRPVQGRATPLPWAYPNPSPNQVLQGTASVEAPTRTRAKMTPTSWPEGTARPTYTSRPPPKDWITDISFRNDASGWVAALDSVMETSDAGATWRRIYTASVPIKQLELVSRLVGWMCTFDRDLLVTRDAGVTWTEATLGDEAPCAVMDFVDARTGWVSTGSQLWRTEDGGESWTQVRHPCGDFNMEYKMASTRTISFLSRTHGWYVCAGIPAGYMGPKALLATDDGGASWRRVVETGPDPEDVFPIGGSNPEISFLNDKYAWMTTSRAGLFITKTGFFTWDLVKWFMMDGPGVASPQVTGIDRGYVIYGTQVVHTVDGGLTWQVVYPH